MMARPAGWALAILLATTGWVAAQNPDYRADNAQPSRAPVEQAPASAYPDQPVMPQTPSLQRRTAADPNMPAQQGRPAAGPQNAAAPGASQPNAGAPRPPFVLTPAEELQLDRLLLSWQNSSQKVKKFRAKFHRFEYKPAEDFQQNPKHDPKQPTAVDEGEMRYESPDKGYFCIDPAANGDTSRLEKWVCDGKSLFQYDFREKKVHEYKLPPEAQGVAVRNGPMPFLFGAKAQDLKSRYWLRMSPQQPTDKNQMVLEAYPKYMVDAQDFKMVEVWLTVTESEVMPTAVQIYLPGGNGRTVYAFQNISVNKQDPLGIFQDPFRARVPSGWQKVVEDDGQGGGARAARAGTGHAPAATGNRAISPR